MVTATTRQQRLEEYLSDRGYVSLHHIAKDFKVSLSTARRDLEDLQKRGVVRRFHGGAVHVVGPEANLDYRLREAQCAEEKARIGRAVAEMIQDGDAVVLAHGTTTYQVAKRLRGRPVQVVTNSLPIANLLGDSQEPETIFVGGFIMPKAGVALGPHAIEMLRNLHVDLAVMGTAGITHEGLFNKHLLIVDVQKTMMESAERVIVAADHTKFGKKSLAKLCDLEEIHHLVTDEKVDRSWLESLRAADVAVHVAPETRESGEGDGADR
jgi:DeoR/GlpR family transcriptional regulator of sugar metabolism